MDIICFLQVSDSKVINTFYLMPNLNNLYNKIVVNIWILKE